MIARAALAALLVGLIAAFAVGCGKDDTSRNDSVAAVIKGVENPFFDAMRDGLVETARRHGVPLRVVAASGLQDTSGQASKLESLIADDAACYVVNPINRTNLLQPLSHIPRRTPIVNIDSPISKESAAVVGTKIATYIGTDNVAAGRLGADAMGALVGRRARVAVIAGIPGDASSGARTEGFRSGARGRFDVVATSAADFDRGKARLAAEAVLHGDPAIKGFFAVNDEMALGVAEAVRAAGRTGKVAVVGVDGIRQALAAVKSGALSATVAQYPYTIGQLGLEACLAAMRDRPVPANLDAPITVVTRDNVARAQASFPKPPESFRSPLREFLDTG
jgi:ABC-type sugar transport system substrate-binding protein